MAVLLLGQILLDCVAANGITRLGLCFARPSSPEAEKWFIKFVSLVWSFSEFHPDEHKLISALP
jgi:hypothetical protein